MGKRWIWFVLIIIATFSLSLAYQETAPVYLFAIEILFLLFALIMSALAYVNVRFRAWQVPGQVQAGEESSIRLQLSTKRIFAQIHGEAYLTVCHRLSGQKYKVRVPFHMPRKGGSLQFPMKLPYAGQVELELTGIRIFEPMGYFGFRRKIATQMKRVMVFPTQETVFVANYHQGPRLSRGDNPETEEKFATDHAGDDPSEIFAFRDYRDGDKISHVNWKMSARQGHWIVKEMSDPIQEVLCLLWGMETDNETDLHAGLCAVYSVAMSLLQEKLAFGIFTSNEKNPDGIIYHVDQEEDLFEALSALMATKGLTTSMVEALLLDGERLQIYPQMLWITDDRQPEKKEELIGLEEEKRLTLWMLDSKAATKPETEQRKQLASADVNNELRRVFIEIR